MLSMSKRSTTSVARNEAVNRWLKTNDLLLLPWSILREKGCPHQVGTKSQVSSYPRPCRPWTSLHPDSAFHDESRVRGSFNTTKNILCVFHIHPVYLPRKECYLHIRDAPLLFVFILCNYRYWYVGEKARLTSLNDDDDDLVLAHFPETWPVVTKQAKNNGPMDKKTKTEKQLHRSTNTQGNRYYGQYNNTSTR